MSLIEHQGDLVCHARDGKWGVGLEGKEEVAVEAYMHAVIPAEGIRLIIYLPVRQHSAFQVAHSHTVSRQLQSGQGQLWR